MLQKGYTICALFACLLLAACAVGCSGKTVRFATFNASLNRDKPGQLASDLALGNDPQAMLVARIVRDVRPDVILLNEFDYDAEGTSARLFHDLYLAGKIEGSQPLHYPHRLVVRSNTGQPSGFDLDRSGQVERNPGSRSYGGDALGFGLFPGQYAFVIYSKFPIHQGSVVELGQFLWRDMPGAMLPHVEPGVSWYSPEALAVLPLSSKNHVDVPIQIDGTTVHVLASHPTPPAFDGPEDRNGKRNHDEIRLWRDYLAGADYLRPHRHGRRPPKHFVIMGDLNADPNDGGSVPGAMAQLLNLESVNGQVAPSSDGATEAAIVQGGPNESHRGEPRYDTADFSEGGNGPGNLRVDYVLPSRTLIVVDSGVFWPASEDPRHEWARDASDHRLVWVDVRVPAGSWLGR
jgi:3-phytase